MVVDNKKRLVYVTGHEDRADTDVIITQRKDTETNSSDKYADNDWH